MSKTNKTIETLLPLRKEFLLLGQAWEIAAGFVPESGPEVCSRANSLFLVTESHLNSLLSEIEEILDRCGNHLSQDVESPCGGGS